MAETTRRELSLPDHLRDGAPFATCSGCGRKSWASSSWGMKCGMTQPGGALCDGRLAPPASGEGRTPRERVRMARHSDASPHWTLVWPETETSTDAEMEARGWEFGVFELLSSAPVEDGGATIAALNTLLQAAWRVPVKQHDRTPDEQMRVEAFTEAVVNATAATGVELPSSLVEVIGTLPEDRAHDEARDSILRARGKLPPAPVEGDARDGDRALQRRLVELLGGIFDAGVNAGIESVASGEEIVRPDEARRQGVKRLIAMVRAEPAPSEGDAREAPAAVGVFGDDGRLRRLAAPGEFELNLLADDEAVRAIPAEELVERWNRAPSVSVETDDGEADRG